MKQPEKLKEDAMPFLQSAPNALTVYPQYYTKEIGLILAKLSKLAETYVKPLWNDKLGL